MNKAILIGNIAREIDSRTTSTGVPYCNFTIAVQRRFKNANGTYDVDFINCVAWRQTAEFIAKYFDKGQKIAINGNIQTRSYDANDGTKRHVTEVIVEEVDFAGESKKKAEVFQEVNEEDLPWA